MTIELKIPNMACPKGFPKGYRKHNRFAYGACAKIITQAVIELDPKASVKADPKTKQVIVNTKVSESSVKDAMPQPLPGADRRQDDWGHTPRASFAIAVAGYPAA